jgi:hypothetical protein
MIVFVMVKQYLKSIDASEKMSDEQLIHKVLNNIIGGIHLNLIQLNWHGI